MASHAALGGTAPIALYQLHHTDGLTTETALRAVLAEVAGLRRQGIVARVGLCNATMAQVRIALDALAADGGVHSVQNEFSLWARDAAKPLPAAGVVARTCKKGVIEFCQVPCVLFRLVCQTILGKPHMNSDSRFYAYAQANGIRFQPYKFFGGLDARRGSKSLEHDFPALAALATARHVSLHALAARWALQRWSCVEHVLGCSSLVRCGGGDRVCITYM
jgi:hypothetical protein